MIYYHDGPGLLPSHHACFFSVNCLNNKLIELKPLQFIIEASIIIYIIKKISIFGYEKETISGLPTCVPFHQGSKQARWYYSRVCNDVLLWVPWSVGRCAFCFGSFLTLGSLPYYYDVLAGHNFLSKILI